MASPKGVHQKRHPSVAALANGTTMSCALRLGLTLLVCTSAIFMGKGQGKAAAINYPFAISCGEIFIRSTVALGAQLAI